MSILMALALQAALSGDEARLNRVVTQAISSELEFTARATREQNIERYMETVPADFRIVEDDGSITDRDALRAKQLQAWAIIPRTNALEVNLQRVEVGCDGQCATAWTDQRWDRQMRGRDGISENNVVTTQRHIERWEVRDGRWLQVSIQELGGTVMVDGQPYR